MRAYSAIVLLAALCASLGSASAADAPVPVAARSVHMWHPAPPAEWFYGEVKVEKSHPGSYFSVIGFSCGYCGIQELYDGSHVAIFSVWDPGDPFDFQIKADSVDEKIRTKNLYAGKGVTIGRFGGEGTGGKSMMPFDWKPGETCRFAVHARRDGDHRAAFTCYLWRDGAWFRMATFSTLQTKGDPAIKGVYSFVEDFRRTRESMQQVRKAAFTSFFAKPAGGEWAAVEAGRFTADRNPILTIDAEVVENGFALTTGGDTVNSHIKVFSDAKCKVERRPEACVALDSLMPDVKVLFRNGDTVEGVKSAVFRIPALCRAPNGDLVLACDARLEGGGDLNCAKPIHIAIRRSEDGGATWTDPVFAWKWKWDDDEHWAGSDPSLVVDAQAKKLFLFCNVWESRKGPGIYRFFVQESSDNGRTWSRPREITGSLKIPSWGFGRHQNDGGFIFITSGSGIQTADGTLVHTLVHVNDGNALFGSTDHGRTWKVLGRPVKNGDECKVVELSDGSLMVNSRWKGGGRQLHVTKDRGMTWESRYDMSLEDPQCNAQLMRVGRALVFSNCKSRTRRHNLHLRVSADEGATWNEGVCVCPLGAAYSDICVVPGRRFGVVYEGAGYATINFTTVSYEDAAAGLVGRNPPPTQ
ncbi:MAG: DUF3472 domain-containing protein [Kiritimatiellae bacterium]|nr:DUF3472 domain-containing protein [Kiritimatiellia bacterium]